MIAEALMCLALNIYHESRGEITAGQIAVANVVMTRVNDVRYPDTVCGVVKDGTYWRGNPVRHRCAFSWWCDGRSDRPLDVRSWLTANRLASDVISGISHDITDGATHYHTVEVQPSWINDRGMVRLGQIGNHIFYRWEK